MYIGTTLYIVTAICISAPHPMREEHQVISPYSVRISNASIDAIVRGIKVGHPNDGEIMIAGHLSRVGVRVPRARLYTLNQSLC